MRILHFAGSENQIEAQSPNKVRCLGRVAWQAPTWNIAGAHHSARKSGQNPAPRALPHGPLRNSKMQISYRFQFSQAHVLTGFLRNLQQVWWVRFKWPLALLFALALAVCVYEGLPVLAVVFAVGIALLLSAPAIARLALHRFRKSPFYNDEIDFSLSESGSHARGRHSEVRHGWEAYTKARRFKDGLLLCHGPDAFHWLPDAAAADPAAIAAAQQLARARIRDYREL